MGYYTRYHLGWDSEGDLGFFPRRDEIMDYIEKHGPAEMQGPLFVSPGNGTSSRMTCLN